MEMTEIQGNHLSLSMARAQLDQHYRNVLKHYIELGPEKLNPENIAAQSQEELLAIALAGDQLVEASLIFCIVAASFIEAVVNLYLALKCDAALFATLERTNIEDKWESLPRLFNSEYKLDLGISPGPGSDLVKLIQIRNKLVHPKPFIKINEDVLHKGKKFNYSGKDQEFFLRLGSLPESLVENLEKYDSSEAMGKLIFMSGIRTDWYVKKRNERAKKS